MPSLHKDPRGKSPFYYCAYSLADGRRAFRSTGKTKKDEAWIICSAFVEMEGKVAEGEASADQLLKVANAALKRLGHDPIKRPSARQWFERWLKTEEGAVSASTLERYSHVVTSFLTNLGPKANGRLSSISTDDIIKFRDELLAGGRSPVTVNHVVRKILKRPFKIAFEEGVIDRNPVAAVRLLRGSTVQKGVFTPSHVMRLVEAAQGDWRGLILMAYFTGGRLKDLSTLKWDNVDLNERSVAFVQKKTGAKVRIPLHPQLQEYLLASPSSDSPKSPVFPELANKRGSGKDGLSASFKRIMAMAGIDGGLIRERQGTNGRSLSSLSFHSLRHSFNSALANANVSQELRRKMTGHASEAMNDLYTHTELGNTAWRRHQLTEVTEGMNEQEEIDALGSRWMGGGPTDVNGISRINGTGPAYIVFYNDGSVSLMTEGESAEHRALRKNFTEEIQIGEAALTIVDFARNQRGVPVYAETLATITDAIVHSTSDLETAKKLANQLASVLVAAWARVHDPVGKNCHALFRTYVIHFAKRFDRVPTRSEIRKAMFPDALSDEIKDKSREITRLCNENGLSWLPRGKPGRTK